MNNLQDRLLPLRFRSILDSQIRHQVARQELTRPLFPDLCLQVVDGDLQITILHAGSQLVYPPLQLIDQPINVVRRNGDSAVQSAAVLHPLPELNASDLSSGGILHEVVQGDTPIAADPGGSVGEGGVDILADTFVCDLARYFGVEKVGGRNLDFFAADVILK